MIDQTKIVNYGSYCNRCKHNALPGTEEPCTDCLSEPVNVNSHKPTKFEEDKT